MINIPTIQSLYTSILADLEGEFQISIPIVGKVLLRAIAAVQAAKLKLFYLGVGSVQKNIFADTADRESAGGTLERFGRVILNRDPFPAVQGQYVLTVNGDTGSTIKALTTFKSNDSNQNPGKLFILDDAYTLLSPIDTITVRALEAGTDSRLFVDDLLTATEPLNGVEEIVAVASEAVEPQAAEDIEDYREKVVAGYRLEPQGGATADYRLWGYDAQGVEEIYPYTKSGSPGEIDVFVEATIAASTDGKGTPSAGIISDVEDVIELDPDTTLPTEERGRRPLGVFAVNVLPVVIREIDVTITGFVDLTSDKQTLILAALTDGMAQVRPFIAGADVISDRNDILSQNNIINLVLQAVPGSVFTSVTMEVDGIALASYQFKQGNIPYLNSVAYV